VAWLDLFRWGRKSANAYDLVRAIAGIFRSKSGKYVTASTAIEVSAVFGGCRLVGHGMAQVPRKLMRLSADGKTRQPARDHPLYSVLAVRANQWQTSFEFFETISWHIELCGHAFSFINRFRGQIVELIPFEPGAVTVKRADDGELTYTVRAPNGTSREFPEEAIWHVRGPSWNAWDGMEVFRIAREAIGLAMVTEESQAAMHKNGVRTSGAWSVEGKLVGDQYASLLKWIKDNHAGPDKTGEPLVMDRAAKWIQTQMSGVDAQHIETRRFQIEEICRFMGIIPIMLGYSDKASTYASAEQMFLAHVVHTLSPRWARFEQSVDAYLLTEQERADGLYFDFVEEGMIRGSVKDTKDAILGYVNGGILTPNEGRAKLDLNPDPDPESDKLRIPVTVVQGPEPDDVPDPTVKAIENLHLELKGQRDRPTPPINVDARTTFSEGAIKVALPEVNVDARTTLSEGALHVAAAPVNVDARTSIEPGAVQVTHTSHHEAPQVHATLAAPDVQKMEITSMPTRESVSDTERDAKGNIKRVTQTEKDA
jgi:HK97 family phage portal protein